MPQNRSSTRASAFGRSLSSGLVPGGAAFLSACTASGSGQRLAKMVFHRASCLDSSSVLLEDEAGGGCLVVRINYVGGLVPEPVRAMVAAARGSFFEATANGFWIGRDIRIE